MSEVGVLNLTIKDNSEQAGQGLNSLAGALRAVKEAKSRLDLSAVAKQVTQLAQTIQNVKGTSTIVKNLGTMFNAINKFANLKDFNIDTEKLRDTAQNMLKLADSKEKVDAASKSGAGVSDWRMGMIGIAESAKETVQTVAEQTDKLEKTLTHFQQMTGKVTDIQLFGGKKQVPGQIAMDLDGTAQRIQEIVSQINIADAVISKTTSEAENAGSRIVSAVSSSAVTGPVTQIADSFRNATTNVRYYSSALDTALPKVQALGSAEMIEAGNARYAAMSERERVLAMAEATGKIPPIDTSRTQEMTANFVQTASEVQNLNISLTETGDIVTSTLIPRFTEMYQIWSMMAYEFGMFANSAKQLMSGESFLALGDGRTPGQLLLGDGSDPQTFLSTWVQTGEQWKQNWVDWASEAAQEMRASWSPDWIIGEGTVTETTAAFESATNAANDLTSSANEAKREINGFSADSIENILASTTELGKRLRGFRGSTETWKAKYEVSEATGVPIEAINHKLASMKERGAEAREEIRNLIDTLNSGATDKMNWANSINRMLGIGAQINNARESASVFEKELENGTSDLAIQMQKLTPLISDAEGETKNLTGRIKELVFGTADLNGSMKRMFPTLTGLLKRFKSMTIMRAMRYLIRQISAGFSEGVQNVYQYSKAVGTNLAPSMDSAASSLLQFKNSIGAMAAPLINAFVPALQTVINWLIEGINYLNQFFALLNGQTSWTKAIYNQTSAYDDTANAAKNAAAATKDLLADWDELNIIQSNSGGGDNNSTTKDVKDYASMFEEVGKFDSELQGIVAGIKEEFGSIWNLAKKIGIALLGWKISNAFAGILGTLGGLLSALGIIDLEFHISTLLNNRYLETGEVGYLVADLLQTLLGSVLMKKVLGKVLGGSLASLAIPIVFTVSALGGIKALVTNTDVSALSEECILSALNTAIKGGVAAGGLLYSLAGVTLGTSLGVGAGAALFTFGATIGIKAIADTIDAGAITGDTIKANLLSAGTIGAGLALTEAILGGTAATIATVGLGGALLTLGALFAIEAVIASKPKNVRWGSYKATEEEIKAFVEGEVFTVSPNTIISVMNPVIQLSKEKDEALTASVDEVKLTVAKLTIGINESDTLSSLEEQIFGNSETGTQGLIGKFKESVRQKQSVIETGILIEPVTTEGDNGEAKQIIDESSEGWKKLTEHMDDLGKRLSEHIAEAYKEGITDEARAMELRTIQELTGMMANVSAAITQGEAEEKAFRVLNEQLTGLTQGSWDQMFAYIEEYKAGITSAYTDAYDAVTDAMAGEVAGLRQSMENALELAGGNENDAKYKEYKSEYERMKERLDARRAGRDKAIDDYADKAMNTETMARIRKTLSGMIDKGAIDKTDINSLGLQDIVGGPEFMNTIWKTLFDEHGIDKGGAKEQMSTWFDRMIDAAFGSDAETIKNAIKLGFLDYGDVISKDVIDQFANVIGITDSPELVNAWNELINSMMIQGDSDTPVYDLELGVDSDVTDPIQAPGIDPSLFNSSLIDMQESAKSAVDYIKSVIESLNNFSVNVSVTERNKAPEGGLPRYMQTRASGGFVRSGDLVMANENGNFELMGKMGNQPVVANNQQIISGISQGVSNANGDVVSELRVLTNLMQRMLQKEFVARAVPGSDWGQHNSRSGAALDRVTG